MKLERISAIVQARPAHTHAGSRLPANGDSLSLTYAASIGGDLLATTGEGLALRLAGLARWQRDLQADALNAALKGKGKDALQPLRELASSADFSKAFWEFRARLTKAGASNPAHELFADFSSGDLAGWRVSGPGLPAKPGRAGMLSLGTGDNLVRAIQPAGPCGRGRAAGYASPITLAALRAVRLREGR